MNNTQQITDDLLIDMDRQLHTNERVIQQLV